MDVASISAALSSTKAVLELAKTAIAARDEAKLAHVMQSLNERIFEIQNAALQLQEKASTMRDEIDSLKDQKRELNARITELERRSADRAQYRLEEIQPGVFVLAHVGAGKDGTPMHYLCQACMDNASKKVVLQEKAHGVVGGISLHCNECKAAYFTGRYAQQRRPSPGQFR
ncbi:hypothetical protein [Paraburkholderia kururiensis]|uniref:hypothetical protein n=1 Tax=Paraburkholderia kururiensis TaxID=984307 RepID=UPI0005A6E2F3|nr:hypothetical protein [Paraburkholderia kururiensis]